MPSSILAAGLLPALNDYLLGAKRLGVSAALLLLAACGGGNSQVLGEKPASSNNNTGSGNGWQANVFEASSRYQHLCAAPRSGRSSYTNISFPDRRGTSSDEKNYLRAWTHETYLWFDEVLDRSPFVASETPQNYFLQLKTTRTTSSGAPKDNFHFFESTEEAEASDAGISFGYGMRYKVYSSFPPRSFYVAYVEPDSPAERAGVMRGDRIVKIDSYDLINENGTSALAALNEGLFPSMLNAAHNFELLGPGTGAEPRIVSLQSAQVETRPVLHSSVLASTSGSVGYVVFNSHVEKAQDEMVQAINQLKQAQVSDLILDLRYNGGGLLSIASQVAYMIAGAQAENKTFYAQIQNAKQPSSAPFPFLDFGLYGLNRNLDLPSLNLNRVFILSTASTCSAGEAIINGLRGINVQVHLIGDTTCGKPYGFYPQANCGTTYYTIQIKGANAKGFGEYSGGFAPSATDNGQDLVKGCRAEDDLNRALGDVNEGLLAAALSYRTSGVCPSAQTRGQQKTQLDLGAGELLLPEARKLLVLDRN